MDSSTAQYTAEQAAEAWGDLARPPRLIVNRENAVFEIHLTSRQRGVLRLHRSGYHSPEAIRSELHLMEILADTGFACPWPLRTRSDSFFHQLGDGQVASVLLWIDAQPIGGNGAPSAISPEDRAGTYRALGALLADLHLTADAMAPENMVRPSWDAEALCGPDPSWGRYWEHPALTDQEAALLLRARDAARVRLEALPPETMGVIHADVLQENVLRDGQQLYLIDFDDCGTGYRHYDLATALIQHAGSPEYPALAAALWQGYRSEGGPLPDGAEAELQFFVMLRAMASAGWITTRASAEDPRQNAYAARAVALAHRFLDGAT